MHRLVFVTTDSKAADRLVERAGKIMGVSLEFAGELDTGRSRANLRERAGRIYADYAEGLSGKAVALRHGVSIQTVSRVVLNPSRYGIRGKPLRRQFPGKPQNGGQA